MKIAYVITRADAVGGATIHVRDLALAMHGRGHQVLVFVGGTGPVTHQFERLRIPFRTLRYLRRSLNPLRDFLAYRELTAELLTFAPDVVSTHTAKAGWLGRAAAAHLGIPVIYTPHGWPFGGRFAGPAAAVYTVAEHVAARWSTAVVCVSESERQVALAKDVADPDCLHVIHNGVRDVPPEFRAAAECESVRICSVARFEAPKDHATLLVALATLQERAWSLDLVGDGPWLARSRRLAARLGIAERVNFRGYDSAPEPVLAASQMFVLSSRSEAFPRSVLEAMRAGLPVVASDVGGVSEAVEEGRTGLLVPPEDPSALAEAIDRLLSDAALRRAFGHAARLAFTRSFELEQTVEKTLALYRAIMVP